MGIAVIGMVRFGVVGNLMSLGAIDFGLLVDGAIVMLEGRYGRPCQRCRPSARDQVPDVLAKAMGQSARTVTFAIAIILLVYLPLMSLEGVEGRMFKPMAITVAMALGGALLFTLTVFPALAATVLRPTGSSDRVKRRILKKVRKRRPRAMVKGGVWGKLQRLLRDASCSGRCSETRGTSV